MRGDQQSNLDQVMMHTQLPVFLHLLANPKLVPGALRLELGGEAADAVAQLISHPEFPEPISSLPRLISAKQSTLLQPDTLAALQAAGYKVVPDSVFFCTDNLSQKPVPTSAQWVDGLWYLAPPTKPTGAQAASRTLALKLVQLVIADADTRDIEDVLRQDPTLSYHLLRLVNSLGMGASRRITSFSQAILMLGRVQLRRWLNLMLFSARTDDKRSAMLLALVTVRSRSMELLARDAGMDRATQDLAFMTGMFSMLGILFGMPLPEVLKPLEVSEILLDALLQHGGPLGGLLTAVECAEQKDVAGLVAQLDALQLTPAQFTLISFEAHQWMLGIVDNMRGGA